MFHEVVHNPARFAKAHRLKIYAQKKLGELIIEAQDNGELLKPSERTIGGNQHTGAVPSENHTKKSLADVGLDKKVSSQAQKVARMSEEKLQEAATGTPST